MTWTNRLVALGACPESIAWGEQYATAQEAWDVCEQPHWMLWWLKHEDNVNQGDLALALLFVASYAQPYLPVPDVTQLALIATIERLVTGDATLADVERAQDAASAAHVPIYEAAMRENLRAFAEARGVYQRACAALVRTYFRAPPV